MTFQEWMDQVDAEVLALTGLHASDFPDYLYRDAWAAEVEPVEVADQIVRSGP